MEAQKIINLLDDNDIELEKFATRKWYIINDQTGGGVDPYGPGDGNQTTKYDTKVIKSNLCDYSDAYILITGNIRNKAAVASGNLAKNVAFKNCAPFTKCTVNINDEFVQMAEDVNIVSPMYNLLEYSDNYQDSTGSLYHFRRDEPPANNGDIVDATTSLVYKGKLIEGTDNAHTQGIKLIVPLKYISNFFRSLEMSLVNCKVDLELTWIKDCLVSSANATAGNVLDFIIIKTQLYVPIVTLLTKDSSKLLKQLNDGFKRSIYWNKYKTIYDGYNGNPNFRKLLDSAYKRS